MNCLIELQVLGLRNAVQVYTVGYTCGVMITRICRGTQQPASLAHDTDRDSYGVMMGMPV